MKQSRIFEVEHMVALPLVLVYQGQLVFFADISLVFCYSIFNLFACFSNVSGIAVTTL